MRSIALFLFALSARADGLGNYFSLADESSSDISAILVPGVDQCFDQAYSGQDAAAKQQFLNLANQIQADKRALQQSASAANMQNAIVHLQSVIDGLNKRVSILCGTERECLEAGFTASDQYPNCLPVNGDTHGNFQYLAFEKLMDDLPEMLSDLQSK